MKPGDTCDLHGMTVTVGQIVGRACIVYGPRNYSGVVRATDLRPLTPAKGKR